MPNSKKLDDDRLILYYVWLKLVKYFFHNQKQY